MALLGYQWGAVAKVLLWRDQLIPGITKLLLCGRNNIHSHCINESSQSQLFSMFNFFTSINVILHWDWQPIPENDQIIRLEFSIIGVSRETQFWQTKFR